VKGDVHTDAPAVTAKLTQMVASRVDMRVVCVCVWEFGHVLQVEVL